MSSDPEKPRACEKSHEPNAETREAIEEAERMSHGGHHRYATAAELLADLDAEADEKGVAKDTV